MAYELRDGQGSLFKNKRKETDKHPDYTGSVMVNGVEHWLSAWIKSGQKGTFMSLSIGKPKEARQERAPAAAPQNPEPYSDEIPF